MDLPDAIWGHVFLCLASRECKRVVEKVSQRFEHIVRSDALCRARWGVVGEDLGRWACVGCDKIEGAAFHPVPWYYDVAHQRRPASYVCSACLAKEYVKAPPMAYPNPPQKGMALACHGLHLHRSVVAEHVFRELCSWLATVLAHHLVKFWETQQNVYSSPKWTFFGPS